MKPSEVMELVVKRAEKILESGVMDKLSTYCANHPHLIKINCSPFEIRWRTRISGVFMNMYD